MNHPVEKSKGRQSYQRHRMKWILITFVAIAVWIGLISLKSANAQGDLKPALVGTLDKDKGNPFVDEQIEQSWHPDYLKLATGDPNLSTDHGVYSWPYELDSIGWNMQSYQDYGGNPYFHHGMDMMKIYGTNVFNRSGGQVVNIENYQPGWDLYWEVAVLDPDGYLWQYHHIDEPTIPQYIWDKYYEYLADPEHGGFIDPDTYIGDIIEWPVWSFGKQFNHIHLNILGAGGVYVNGFEFHEPLADADAPEIQEIGLLKNGQVVPGDTIDGDYSLYVRSRDLILDDVYYLPPWEITFSVDGGPENTTWRFDMLPGGADDTAYLDDFYVVPPTCGNYDCRDYYIDVGFIPDSQYEFPVTGGEHAVTVTVHDYAGNADTQVFTYTVIGPPPGTLIWQDDFETDSGWTPNPDGSDTATSGKWEWGDPQSTYSGGPKQLGDTPSGTKDLVTGRLAGGSATTYDIDGGITSIGSPEIKLPMADSLILSFRYYLAHGTDSSASDTLRLTVEGLTTSIVFEELGADENDDGFWAIENVDITEFANQSVRLLIKAADEPGESLVEAGIDDVLIIGNGINLPPFADSQSLSIMEDTPVEIILTGTDPEGDPLTFSVVSTPTHGILGGVAPSMIYTPTLDYNGVDSFAFIANDGHSDSDPAIVNIDVTPVNDAPVAIPMSITTRQSTPVTITLGGSDIDGDILGYQVTVLPQHGWLSGIAPNLTYTPNAGYAGMDAFSFIVNDGVLDSEAAIVEIAINYGIYIPVIIK